MTADTMELRRDRITARARAADPRKVALFLLTGVFIALGWVAAKILGVAWFAAAWAWYALVEGFETGWATRPRVSAPPG